MLFRSRTPDDAARIVTMVEQVFEEYVKEIEQPGRDGSRTAVRLTGDPPEVTRVNNPITTAVLAAIAGLVSGIAIALYRDRTDEVLRSPGQLARVGLTYRGIATIGDNGRQNSQEGFRKLAVECLMSDDRGGTRLMVSGVGAEAPTFDVAHGLAVGFASYGRATVLLDTGTDEDSSRPGLSDFLAGLAPWQACTELPQAGSVATVSAGSQRGRLDELLIRANRNGLELPVDADGQMVVVAPSILASPVGAALSGFVDACLLVATLHVSLLSDLVEAALTLEALECRLVGIVVVSEDGQRAVRKAGRESVPTDLAPATVASSEP